MFLKHVPRNIKSVFLIKQVRYQNIDKQVKTQASERFKMVKMKSEFEESIKPKEEEDK